MIIYMHIYMHIYIYVVRDRTKIYQWGGKEQENVSEWKILKQAIYIWI
jgi:hypothetical protein